MLNEWTNERTMQRSRKRKSHTKWKYCFYYISDMKWREWWCGCSSRINMPFGWLVSNVARRFATLWRQFQLHSLYLYATCRKCPRAHCRFMPFFCHALVIATCFAHNWIRVFSYHLVVVVVVVAAVLVPHNCTRFFIYNLLSYFFFMFLLCAQIINGKYVEGFYIYARQLDADANDLYKMLTVLNGGGASTCTITGLRIYTRYEFFVVPFYKSVEGKPSNSRIARTLEDGKCWKRLFSCSWLAGIKIKQPPDDY